MILPLDRIVLQFQPRPRTQAAFIEQLGSEGANLGMQAPCFFEKQTPVGRNRRMAAEYVVEGGNIGAFGMTALHRLLELLRIAEQHDGFCRLRNSKHIGERHLRGLIDEQHIDGLKRVWACPEPCGAAGNLTIVPIAAKSSALSVANCKRGRLLSFSETF